MVNRVYFQTKSPKNYQIETHLNERIIPKIVDVVDVDVVVDVVDVDVVDVDVVDVIVDVVDVDAVDDHEK